MSLQTFFIIIICQVFLLVFNSTGIISLCLLGSSPVIGFEIPYRVKYCFRWLLLIGFIVPRYIYICIYMERKDSFYSIIEFIKKHIVMWSALNITYWNISVPITFLQWIQSPWKNYAAVSYLSVAITF